MKMASKGGLGHLKSLPAPWFWPIHRKERPWAPKPSPGPHRSYASLPMALIIRDELDLAKTRREVSSILAGGKVKVDGRTRLDENYPVGLMDVIELADANVAYRVLPIERRGLSLVRIAKDEARFKLCKILGKRTLTNGMVQINLHDGRNITLPATEAAPYSTRDTLRISIPGQRILGAIKFDKGNHAIVVAGRNLGKSGKITEIEKGTATRPAMVTLEDAAGTKLETMADYTFVVGTEVPAIKLGAA